MTITKHVLAAAIVLGGFATTATAATFDFVSIADAYDGTADSGKARHEAEFDTMKAFDAGVFTEDGVTITDMIASYSFGNFAEAFFDKTDGSGPAGLGVCHTVTPQAASGCSSAGGTGSAPGDDNTTVGEAVTIMFDQSIDLMDVLFYDGKHKALNGDVTVNGVTVTAVSGLLAAADYAAINASSLFSANEVSFAYADSQFYVGSISVAAVPVPAAGLLLLAGLGGLGALKRRRKSA